MGVNLGITWGGSLHIMDWEVSAVQISVMGAAFDILANINTKVSETRQCLNMTLFDKKDPLKYIKQGHKLVGCPVEYLPNLYVLVIMTKTVENSRKIKVIHVPNGPMPQQFNQDKTYQLNVIHEQGKVYTTLTQKVEAAAMQAMPAPCSDIEADETESDETSTESDSTPESSGIESDSTPESSEPDTETESSTESSESESTESPSPKETVTLTLRWKRQ